MRNYFISTVIAREVRPKQSVKLKDCFAALAMMLCVLTTHAQNLTLTGKITFERKENMHKLIEENDNDRKSSWVQKIKEQMPKYRTDIFELNFNSKRSLYKPIQEDENPYANWYARVAYNNVVYTDLSTNKQTVEKAVYELQYSLVDSLPALQWKMLGEFREIAGYNCRKAGAIINDSLYVIAFYTEQIPVSSGPESIKGLPGMVLGVVIPRLNITIFATKVETIAPTEKELSFTPRKKFKPSTQNDFIQEILKGLKDWGEWGHKIYFKALL